MDQKVTFLTILDDFFQKDFILNFNNRWATTRLAGFLCRNVYFNFKIGKKYPIFGRTIYISFEWNNLIDFLYDHKFKNWSITLFCICLFFEKYYVKV